MEKQSPGTRSKQPTRFSLRILSLALLATLAASNAHSATAGSEPTCINDWSVAAPIVRQERLATVKELTRRAAAKLPGQIIRTTLCQGENGYIYQLVVRDPKGQLQSVEVDARHPFEKR